MSDVSSLCQCTWCVQSTCCTTCSSRCLALSHLMQISLTCMSARLLWAAYSSTRPVSLSAPTRLAMLLLSQLSCVMVVSDDSGAKLLT